MSIPENLKKIKSELPSDVTLVAVSKYHSPGSILEAYDVGQRIFAESRPQELRDKSRMLPADIEWHFIGHLQPNKIKYVVPVVSLIHSCDSAGLLFGIDDWCVRNGFTTEVLLELHIASEQSKQGFTRDELSALLERVASGEKLSCVKIRGLMGMASLTDDADIIRDEFSALMKAYEDIAVRQYPFLDRFDIRSFGMSSDWKIAVRMGATHVRVGTSIFGEREY